MYRQKVFLPSSIIIFNTTLVFVYVYSVSDLKPVGSRPVIGHLTGREAAFQQPVTSFSGECQLGTLMTQIVS